MIPDNQFSSVAVPAAFLDPDYRDISGAVDYEMGGVALNDPSQGHFVYVWKAWYDAGTIWCSVEDGSQVTALITGLSDVTEVAFAFDQNMRPLVAYVRDGVTHLWWYDSAIAAMRDTTYPYCTSPKLCHDDKRVESRNTSDVLFFYIRDQALHYRQQRDRYDTEYWLADLPDWVERISAVGLSAGLRLQVLFRPKGVGSAIAAQPGCVTPTKDAACVLVTAADYHGA